MKRAIFIFMLGIGCSSPGLKGKYVAFDDTGVQRIASEKVKGEACRWFIFFVPVGDNRPHAAYQDAIAKSPPGTEGLAEARIYAIAPAVGGVLLGKYCTHVEGFPARRA